ncbi:hypothetical protein CYMTET_32552, partial [Cymbomonas tetramitiformis]
DDNDISDTVLGDLVARLLEVTPYEPHDVRHHTAAVTAAISRRTSDVASSQQPSLVPARFSSAQSITEDSALESSRELSAGLERSATAGSTTEDAPLPDVQPAPSEPAAVLDAAPSEPAAVLDAELAIEPKAVPDITPATESAPGTESASLPVRAPSIEPVHVENSAPTTECDGDCKF